MAKMNTARALRIIRNILRNSLVDPYTYAGAKARPGDMWVYTDEPVTMPKFPQIQLKKLDNPTEPIDIGPNYMEHEQLIVRIWFYSKNGFKITYEGDIYTNAEFVELYVDIIKRLLKSKFKDLKDKCLVDYKHINTSVVQYSPETQLYAGNVTIRVRWFSR
jgi:hypothetical protein